MSSPLKKQNKKILITGIAGFIGSHLADYAVQRGYQVVGIKRKNNNAATIAHIAKKNKFFDGDATKQTFMTKILSREQPDFIFHLASLLTPRKQSNTKSPNLTPEKILLTNLQMTKSLLEATRILKKQYLYNPVVVLIGSSEEYGKVPQKKLPIQESTPLHPITHYATSKVLQELFGKTYYKTYGLKIVLIRLFNQHGPRQQERLIPAVFAKQIAAIEAGLQEPIIHHGNLNAKRDFTDVRDTARALIQLAEKTKNNKRLLGTPFNIASGKKHFYSIKQVLNMLLSMSRSKIKTRTDQKRMRKAEIPAVLGSYQKLHNATGWQPNIPIKKTLRDSLNYWRRHMQTKKIP